MCVSTVNPALPPGVYCRPVVEVVAGALIPQSRQGQFSDLRDNVEDALGWILRFDRGQTLVIDPNGVPQATPNAGYFVGDNRSPLILDVTGATAKGVANDGPTFTYVVDLATRYIQSLPSPPVTHVRVVLDSWNVTHEKAGDVPVTNIGLFPVIYGEKRAWAGKLSRENGQTTYHDLRIHANVPLTSLMPGAMAGM